ncbi:MAG: TonB family protein [Terriglobales bacterium]
MSYKALLFCPDERTAKTVTQVLSELEFQVEACNEPFAAVKKLMAGHFDAVVVDCDNEQNATLLFKSARNSEFNQASLSVAVVEGQSGVAKAFRIGANLVLTKPINVEQSKGTLRVARGLLRKNEAAKASGKAPEAPARLPMSSPPQAAYAPVISPKPAFLTHAAPALAPAVTASSSSAFELEKDPTPEPEPAEAAFLESVSDQANQIHSSEAGASSPKQYPWQPVPKPMAEPMAQGMTTALRHAAEATSTIGSGISVGHGAAVAPAREPDFQEEDSPSSSSSAVAVVKSSTSGSSVNWGRIAITVLVAAAAGGIYRAGTQLHWQIQPVTALIHKSTTPATSQIAKPGAGIPAVATPAPNALTTASAQPGVATVPQNPNQTLIAGTNQQKLSTNDVVALPLGKKPAVPASSFDPPASPGVVKPMGDVSPDTIVVDTQTPKPAAPKPAAVESVEPAAPDAVSADSQSTDQAISGLVSMPAGIAQPGPTTLKVSQGVSQGLLVKKVAPAYPPQALQAHMQGSVQLLATISKAGDITNVKVLKGEPVLARAAANAVKQWKYKPYLLDSQPMEIQTQITVNFTLP